MATYKEQFQELQSKADLETYSLGDTQPLTISLLNGIDNAHQTLSEDKDLKKGSENFYRIVILSAAESLEAINNDPSYWD